MSMQLSVQPSDSREALISVLVLLLPAQEDHEDLLLDPRIGVGIPGGLLETVYELRGGGEGFVEGGRVFGESFEESESSDLLVSGSVLDLLSDGSRGFVGSGSLEVTEMRLRKINREKRWLGKGVRGKGRAREGRMEERSREGEEEVNTHTASTSSETPSSSSSA